MDFRTRGLDVNEVGWQAWATDELKILAGAFVANWLRYIIVAGGVYILLYHTSIVRARPLRRDGLSPPTEQIVREVILSTTSCFIFALSAVAIHATKPLGVTHVYHDWNAHGIGYLAISLVIMVFSFDAYFYFTHRMLHIVGVKRSTHNQHHASVFPTPWAALAFSLPEAFIISLFFFLITTAIPIQFNVFRLFFWIVFIQSALQHSSYEMYPRWWSRVPIIRAWNTPIHHHLHHRFGRYNFGLYFTLWDRLLKTEHPDMASPQNAVAAPS